MEVKLDTSKADATLRKQAKELSAKELIKASKRAVNAALRSGNTAMSKEIRKTVNLRASTVKEATRLSKASGDSATAEIRVETQGIPLDEYSGSFGKKGLTVRVKGGKRSRIEGAFAVKTSKVKQIRGGGEANAIRAFERVDDARFPIQMLFGPSVRTQAEKALPVAAKRINEALEGRLIFFIGRAVERANR